MGVLEDFGLLSLDWNSWECTPTEMSSNKWTAFHDLTQIFQLPVKTSCATNKKTRGMVPSGLEASPNASSTQLL